MRSGWYSDGGNRVVIGVYQRAFCVLSSNAESLSLFKNPHYEAA